MTSPGTGILDELDWRGLIAQSTDRDALAAAAAAGPLTVYAGLRPDGAEPARRTPGSAADAAALPAGRAPADRPRRRCDRDDRRPPRRRRTHAEHRRHRRRVVRPHPRAAGAIRRLRRVADRRDRREQPDLDLAALGDRIPARRRQALLGQRDARPRHHPAAARGRRHLLHRVQLHAVAGQRLRRAAPASTAARCRSAAPTSGATSSPASAWSGRSSAPRRTR